MSDILEEQATFTIDELDYEVSFHVEATRQGGYDSFEIFGSRMSVENRALDFELNEICSVTCEGEEVKLDKLLEKKLRVEIYEWISDHNDELSYKISDY